MTPRPRRGAQSQSWFAAGQRWFLKFARSRTSRRSRPAAPACDTPPRAPRSAGRRAGRKKDPRGAATVAPACNRRMAHTWGCASAHALNCETEGRLGYVSGWGQPLCASPRGRREKWARSPKVWSPQDRSESAPRNSDLDEKRCRQRMLRRRSRIRAQKFGSAASTAANGNDVRALGLGRKMVHPPPVGPQSNVRRASPPYVHEEDGRWRGAVPEAAWAA